MASEEQDPPRPERDERPKGAPASGISAPSPGARAHEPVQASPPPALSPSTPAGSRLPSRPPLASPPPGTAPSRAPRIAAPTGAPIPAAPGALLDEIAAATPQRSLIDELLDASGLPPSAPERELVARGLEAFFGYALRHGIDASLVDGTLIDLVIANITERLARQIDEVLHHPLFQALEGAWRGLKLVIDRVDFRENIRVEILNVSKRDLLEDFQDAPELTKSGMYRIVYSAEYGVFGGRPYGLLVGNYEFSPLPQDIYLLDQCAAVATMAHAPFIAAAAPKFFGLEDFHALPQLADVAAIFEGPQYTKWRAFRDSEDSRYVGLTLPRFLLRLPYGPETVRVRAFEYQESVANDHEHYLWGNAAFAFATRVADSFARYRWCPNIIGPSSGGTVDGLPIHRHGAMGLAKIPTEVMITERLEFELSELGFIALTYRRDTGDACFFSASSAQKPKYFGIGDEARQAALNHRLGTQLPYIFMTCRIAHYLKVLQREQIGSWKERADLERELQAWLNQLTADQEVVSSSVRARRPLRKAKVTVTEVDGNAGWYKVDVQLRPHFKYMGASFEVGLVGRLDKD